MKMFKYYITNDVDTDYEKHFPGREECVAWIIENLDYKKYTWEYGQIHKDGLYIQGHVRTTIHGRREMT